MRCDPDVRRSELDRRGIGSKPGEGKTGSEAAQIRAALADPRSRTWLAVSSSTISHRSVYIWVTCGSAPEQTDLSISWGPGSARENAPGIGLLGIVSRGSPKLAP